MRIVVKVLLESTERIFRVPFMVILKENGDSTSEEIIDILRKQFNPDGHDAETISGRKDDYFSQKVRNIKSHSSLNDYVEYKSKKEGWCLKAEGYKFLNDNAEIVEEINRILSNDSFSYSEKISFIDEAIVPFFPRRVMKAKTGKATVKKKYKKIIFYDENVSEGKVTTKTIIVRERSRKLRDKAIEHFKIGDKIKCSICGFEFAVTYGEYGKGYIEIHHKKPVYQYDDKDIDIVLKDALDNLTPVCANCHRMLHHQKGITYDEVKKIYDDNNKKVK